MATDLVVAWEQVANEPVRYYPLAAKPVNGRVVHAACVVDGSCYAFGCSEMGVSESVEDPGEPRMRVTIQPYGTEITCRRCIERGMNTYPTALPTYDEAAIALYAAGRCPAGGKTHPPRHCGEQSAPGEPYGACADHAAEARADFQFRMTGSR